MIIIAQRHVSVKSLFVFFCGTARQARFLQDLSLIFPFFRNFMQHKAEICRVLPRTGGAVSPDLSTKKPPANGRRLKDYFF